MLGGHRATLLAILVMTVALNLLGIHWGVPSVERNGLYFSSDTQLRESIRHVDSAAVTASMSEKKGELAGSAFIPIRSYHPDESNFIKGISNMKPRQLDFNPHYLYYGTLYIYSFALVLAVGVVTGLITATPDILFYFLHPHEMANIYVAGRLVSAGFSLLCVMATYRLAQRHYGDGAGLLAAALLAASPLSVINAHFIATDATASFFVMLTLVFAARILVSQERRWFLLAGIAAGLAAQAKYNAGAVVLAVPLAVLLSDAGIQRRRLLTCWFDRNALFAYAGSFITFLLLIAPFILGAIEEYIFNFKAGLFREPAAPFVPKVISNSLFFIEAFRRALGLPLFLLAAAGMVMALIRREKIDILLLFWFGLTMAILIVMSPPYDRHMRYLTIVGPAVVILAARAATLFFDRRPKIATPLIILLAFVPTLLFSAGYVRIFMQENVRTTAGHWIAGHIPAGSTIGLRTEPWQYATPPLDQKRYILKVTGVTPEKSEISLRQDQPDYFIVGNAEHFGRETDWHSMLTEAGYACIRSFTNPPSIFGWPYNRNSSGYVDDFLYLYPEIHVYERKNRNWSRPPANPLD
jgi:hypothetical protein